MNRGGARAKDQTKSEKRGDVWRQQLTLPRSCTNQVFLCDNRTEGGGRCPSSCAHGVTGKWATAGVSRCACRLGFTPHPTSTMYLNYCKCPIVCGFTTPSQFQTTSNWFQNIPYFNIFYLCKSRFDYHSRDIVEISVIFLGILTQRNDCSLNIVFSFS